MPNGGYVMTNLIGLCSDCHVLAEETLITIAGGDVNSIDPTYAPGALYAFIGSSYERALEDSSNDHA